MTVSSFPPENSLKHRDATSPLSFNIAFEFAIVKMQESEECSQLNGKHHFMTCSDDVKAET
jgi:hypothetical protein